MEFTFGIITNNSSCCFINEMIDSIEIQNIEKYEIIIVGDIIINRKNTIIIPFDETIHPTWTTKKKNMITHNATYENIVYMHDYIKLDENWYNGFLNFGNDFHVISNKIINLNNERFHDWNLNFYFLNGFSLQTEHITRPDIHNQDT